MNNNHDHKNILLIAPPLYDFASFDLWLKPLGLLYIASFLKKAGFRIRLVDALDRYHPAMTELTPKEKEFGTGKYFREKVQKPAILNQLSFPRSYYRHGMPKDIFEKELTLGFYPDLILITSMMTYWYPGVFESIQTVKRLFPDIPVLLGGIYAKLCPDHAKIYSGASTVITSSHPDDILTAICNALHLHKIPAQTSLFDEWPFPDLSLYSNLKYAPVMTSMGCPYQCTYCASSRLYPSFTQRTPEKVAEEIFLLHTTRQISDFAFFDDALLVNKKNHLYPLFDILLKSHFPLRFHTPNGLHTKFIDDETAELFWNNHFKTLRLSLETADPRLQASTGGKISNCDFQSAVKALHKAGYKPPDCRTYIMAGMPGQTLQQIRDAVSFVLDSGACPSLCEYSLIPGSSDWIQLEKKMNLDRLDPLLHNNTIFSLYMGWMSYQELEDLKSWMRKKIKDYHLFPNL